MILTCGRSLFHFGFDFLLEKYLWRSLLKQGLNIFMSDDARTWETNWLCCMPSCCCRNITHSFLLIWWDNSLRNTSMRQILRRFRSWRMSKLVSSIVHLYCAPLLLVWPLFFYCSISPSPANTFLMSQHNNMGTCVWNLRLSTYL